MSDFMDFFFKKMHTNESVLQFAGENERADFHDWAVELGCCPSLTETHEGESKEDKDKRKAEEQKQLEAKEKQRLQMYQRKAQVTQEERDRKKILSMFRSLTNQKFKEKKGKYEKTKSRFEMEYKNYIEEYEKEIEGIIGDIINNIMA